MSGRRSRDAAGGEEPDPGSGEDSEPAAHGGRGESDGDGCFAEAMRDVEPLADRDKVQHSSPAIAAPTRRVPARQISFEFPRVRVRTAQDLRPLGCTMSRSPDTYVSGYSTRASPALIRSTPASVNFLASATFASSMG